MKILTLLMAGFLLVGCTSTPRDNSWQLTKSIVGQWEWKEGPEECIDLVNMAFRMNGTYTRTSESCNFSDDGFGNFYYGWYIAHNHICFVAIDEQFEDEKSRNSLHKKIYIKEKKAGYSQGKCPWKIESIRKNSITIGESYGESKAVTFTMVRKRWL